MKIKKNEFIQKESFYSNAQEQIQKVFNPFNPMIKRSKLIVYISTNQNFELKLKADWFMY